MDGKHESGCVASIAASAVGMAVRSAQGERQSAQWGRVERLGAWRSPNAFASAHESVDERQGYRQPSGIQILLGHTKIANTVRDLGVDIEDALMLAERTEI